MTTTLPPQASYVLTIVADSGYESTMEGRCDAGQYALAVKALHEPATVRADLEVEVARLREALKEITYDYADRFDMESPSTNLNIKNIFKQARTALEKQP